MKEGLDNPIGFMHPECIKVVIYSPSPSSLPPSTLHSPGILLHLYTSWFPSPPHRNSSRGFLWSLAICYTLLFKPTLLIFHTLLLIVITIVAITEVYSITMFSSIMSIQCIFIRIIYIALIASDHPFQRCLYWFIYQPIPVEIVHHLVCPFAHILKICHVHHRTECLEHLARPLGFIPLPFPLIGSPSRLRRRVCALLQLSGHCR